MPAVSKKQQRFMGAVRAAQKGATPISGKVASVAKEMEPADVKKFAATKHKGLPNKVKKESFENTIGEIYAVRKPYENCDQASLVHKVDPLQGIMEGGEYTTEMFHGIYNDEKQAHSVAESLYNEYFKGLQALEEKKEMTGNKIKKAIDQLEKQRKKHVDMAKENPAEASKCKQHIAQLTTKIDDLMTKMERIEKSKKQLEKAEDKEDKKKELKENKAVESTLKGIKDGEMVELVLDDNSKKIMQRAGSNKKGEPTFKHVKDGKATGSASAVSVSHIKSVKKHKK